ncbi:MAG: DUF3880 domain-containing protein [Humidesulfovibrio sp.]|nr:DUF3880 domain-containing protein [Humidesulfovibrio sp.]
MPNPADARPRRPRVLDELGLPKTLPANAPDFLPLFGTGPDALLLGLGPEPEGLAELLGLRGHVRYVETPDMAEQLGQDWRGRIPDGFEELPADAFLSVASSSRVILYRPGPRLFPGFWGPLVARLQLSLLPQAPAPDPKLVWLPGGEADLLRLELREAFEGLGYRVRELPDETALRALLAGGECPALYFSVNFRGLDLIGEAAHLLEAAGARIAVWCVDNPLHLLSGIRSRFWTRLPLFVTDHWFVEPLKQLGAGLVRHLPLAARAQDLAGPARPPSPARADLAERLVFVGRSAFPGKADFFAGCRVPDAAWTEARRLMDAGGRPDFGWWLTRLGIDRLWPGAEVRKAGFCAEEAGKAWRTDCLARAQADLSGALTVFGDAEWRPLLPEGTDLRGPVDYYAALPDLCASAAACLNCTSPLLPHGLTQRHFDTWAFGGLLLTDATPGLDLFPLELTRAITFRTPRDIAPRFKALRASASGAEGLKNAWRAELARAHTYAHRVQAVLEAVGLG